MDGKTSETDDPLSNGRFGGERNHRCALCNV